MLGDTTFTLDLYSCLFQCFSIQNVGVILHKGITKMQKSIPSRFGHPPRVLTEHLVHELEVDDECMELVEVVELFSSLSLLYVFFQVQGLY